MGCFTSKKQYKIDFYNFCLFLAHFEQKVAKNVFFVIFSQMVIFGQKFNITNVFLWNSLSKNVYFYVLLIKINSFKGYDQYKIRQK